MKASLLILHQIETNSEHKQQKLFEAADIGPFVKWVGGKSSLLAQYKPLFPQTAKNYFEPFVGGGAVFFHLKAKNISSLYTLNDMNPELISVYRIVRDEVDALVLLLSEFKAKHSKEFYYKVRAWDRVDTFKKRTDLERAARFLYLNRTCYNGLWRVNSKGQFNVPMGRYKNPNIENQDRLRGASQALQGVKLTNLDFSDCVAAAQAGDFVYFDPPYIPLNATSNFTSYSKDGFDLKDQERLAETVLDLHDRGCNVMVSNSSAQIVYDIYNSLGISSLTIHSVEAKRRINSKSKKRGEIAEVVIVNY